MRIKGKQLVAAVAIVAGTFMAVHTGETKYFFYGLLGALALS